MKLSELQKDQKAIIIKVQGRGAFRKRLTEMGFVKGREIKVVKYAPLQDPVEYEIMGYSVSLRRSETSLIEVITRQEAELMVMPEYNGVFDDDVLKTTAEEKGSVINVVLIGNPNCGKTTIFNYASKSKEHVGNYAGVTIDAKTAKYIQGNYTFNITDLPGTYSLSAYTPEELYVRKYLKEQLPDIIINVVDASNLERNLFLTTQLVDMDSKVIIALNMFDELQKSGSNFDYIALARMIGVPIIPTVGSKGDGITELFAKVADVYEDKEPIVRHVHVNYGVAIENAIAPIKEMIRENIDVTSTVAPRFLAIKLIEDSADSEFQLDNCANHHKIIEVAKEKRLSLQLEFAEDPATIIADARYGFIAGALKETYSRNISGKRKMADRIDHVLTHKYFGFPIFIFFMWLVFEGTFTLGAYPMAWIEQLVTLVSQTVSSLISSGSLKDLLINGIIGGVGGVIIYLPNIVFLFLFISLMEDSGYMARTAFIMDRLMHKIGLHGKSFIPLLMGFGCNVPAIMATRTLENKNDRLLTMLIIPFMSCSARLPVYILLLGAFFPYHSGSMLFAIYTLGIIIAVLVALVFKKTLFNKEEAPFVMELPPYRIPTVKNTTLHMWSKAFQYLQKMGGVILIASILIWALSYYPRKTIFAKDYSKQKIEIALKYDSLINKSIDKKQKSDFIHQKNKEISHVIASQKSEQQAYSIIGKMGKAIEPIIRPLGFEWKMGVSLISGLAAKEVIVSTMGVLYEVDSDNKSGSLKMKLREQVNKTGNPLISPLSALSFMVFILIYFPCIAVIAAVRKETGSVKWAGFMMLYTTGLAWLMAFVVYQVGSLF